MRPAITIRSETLAFSDPKLGHGMVLRPAVIAIFLRPPCTSLPPGIARWSAPEPLPAHAVRRSENDRKVFRQCDRRGRCECDCRRDRRRLSPLPDMAR